MCQQGAQRVSEPDAFKKNELRSRDSRVASQTNKRSDLKALTYEADNAKQWGLGVVHRDL